MTIIDDIWCGVCDFANYVWGNADLVAFLCLADLISYRFEVLCFPALVKM